MTPRKTRKRGGEFVGKGAYGCGFYPGFPCQGDNSANTGSFFTKLMYTVYAKDEWKVSETMKRIDPEFKFSVYPHKMCLPRMEDADRFIQEGISQCSLRSPHEFYRIKDDKAMLRDLIRHKSIMMLQSEQAGSNLHTIEVSPIDIYPFFKGFTNLFNGIEFYQNKKFHHLDIKPPNIVSRKEPDGSYNTRFIDFGLGKLLKNIITYSPDYIRTEFFNYPYYAYELRFLEKWSEFKYYGFQIKDEDFNNYINNILSYVNFYVPKETYYTYNGTTQTYILQATKEFYMQLAWDINTRNNNKWELSEDIYTQLLEAGDVYSLGLTLAEVYRRIIKHFMFFGKIYKIRPDGSNIQLTPESADFPIEYTFGMEICKPMYNLIKKMTDKNPFTRISIKDAKMEYKGIVEKMKPFFGIANINEHPEIATLFGTTNENSFVEAVPTPPETPPKKSKLGAFIGKIGSMLPFKRKGGNKTRRRIKKSNLKK